MGDKLIDKCLDNLGSKMEWKYIVVLASMLKHLYNNVVTT